MTRKSVRSETLILVMAGLCGWIAVADQAGAQNFPQLAARHAGSGYYEIRGGGGKWDLSEARVVLDEQGGAAIAVSGRTIQLSMSGRITGYNGREHVSIVLDSFDGRPTNARGWLAVDRRGGFLRIEFDGNTPTRLGVSFRSRGPNLEPPTDQPGPPGGQPTLTEELGIDLVGSDYLHISSDELRSCQESCRGDSRCRAYSFNARNRNCYLKFQVPHPTRDRNVVSGVKLSWGGSPGWEGGGEIRLAEERGYDRRGSDFTDFRANNLEECQNACRREGRCRAYTYDTRTGACFLKDRANPRVGNSATVTGYKEE